MNAWAAVRRFWGVVPGYFVVSLLVFGLGRDLERVHYLDGGTGGGAAASVRPAVEGPRALKVMSYNLNHVSRGNDNDPANDPYFPRGSSEIEKLGISLPSLARDPGRIERNLGRIVGAIAAEDPDVVLLQEADRGLPESLWIDAAAEIARRTGFPYGVWGAKWSAFCGFKYVTGNAILSKYPIVGSANAPLNPVSWRRFDRMLFGAHTLLRADIDVGGRRVSVFNTHLYSKKKGYGKKREQVLALLGRVREVAGPVIVGGDFNTSPDRLRSWRPGRHDPTLPLLDADGTLDMDGVFADDMLDYIFLRRGDVTRYRAQYRLEPVATDHYICVAVVELGDGMDAEWTMADGGAAEN